MTNYIEKFIILLRGELPDIDDQLLKYYALLGIVKGPSLTLEDVHDAWAIWRNDTNPEHKSLIPFDDLTPEVQELDGPYRNAIIKVARKLSS